MSGLKCRGLSFLGNDFLFLNSESIFAMKKLVEVILLLVVSFSYATVANASGGHGKGHYKHKYKHRKEVVHYYVPVAPAPVIQPRPYYSKPEGRTTEGLAGGVVGSALGYQLGNGSPITTGVGAAAGAYIGNEIAK